MAVEHVFPPIPSELVLPLAGFEVARGNLTLIGALAASTTGSMIGASILYLLARRGGRPLVLRLRRVLRIDEAELRMPFGRYLALTASGSLLWNTVLIVAGQQLGSRSQVGDIVGPVAQWVLLTIIPLSLLALAARHRRKPR